jgi:hypothetical protein
MTTYLTIITSVLVLTQIIRLIQNAMQLVRFGKARKFEQDEVLRAWKRMEIAMNKLIERLDE